MEQEPNIKYENARKKVREIKSFYYSLLCYCILMPVLVAVNLAFTPQYHWFWFSMAGWGTGLLFHAMSAFGWMPFLGSDWESTKLRELMEKDKQQQNKV